MKNDNLINLTLDKLNISHKELEDFSNYYNNDYSAYGNEVYEDIKVRLVHLDNFLKENWWNNRFYFLFRDFCKYEEIVDIGFSVPYLPIYLSRRNRIQELPRLVYVDGNETSKKLATIILDMLGIKARFVVGDAQNQNTWNDIKEVTLYGKRLFTAFETIEHFEKPELFWKELANYNGDILILSLPIGKKIPSHHSVFSDEVEVTNYLEKYLNISEMKVFSSAEIDYKIYTAIGTIK